MSDTVDSRSAVETANARDDIRAKIVIAAATLLASGGQDAVTTRAVAAAADVQAPTIYRLFGDKHGLLDAVAEHDLATYMAEKSARDPHPDPVQDLRDGWDMHVAFGLAHPGVFAIMSSGGHSKSPAVVAGLEVLRRRVNRIARGGRLRVSEDRAVSLLRAMGNGTVLTLLNEPAQGRDAGLSETAREAFIAAVVTDAGAIDAKAPSTAAIALRAALPGVTSLTDNERGLMDEWLGRLIEDKAV